MISARVHYACLALVELAVHRERATPVATAEITQRHGIPQPFLVQILRTLRSAGWVQSVRGSQGGYRLAVNPSELTLLDVAEMVGGCDNGNQTEKAGSTIDETLHGIWDSANNAHREVLSKTTIDQLAAAASQDEEVMFYI